MKHILILLILTMVVGCREGLWERTLAGPFEGEPYNGTPSEPVVSSLKLPDQNTLYVHQLRTNAPILHLRDNSGRTVWARVLTLELEGQDNPRGHIISITLNKAFEAKNGYKISVSCDWIGGGKEKGIIYLKENGDFKALALSW